MFRLLSVLEGAQTTNMYHTDFTYHQSTGCTGLAGGVKTQHFPIVHVFGRDDDVRDMVADTGGVF